jgi:hypothetical protein
MSTNGTCIEPNYVVPGANPCRDDNPDNLPPTAPTHIGNAVLGITTWSLSFTQGQFARTNTCFVTLPNGTGQINGFCSGNIASFFGLTGNTAYIATITSVNQFGSTASSPPFAFTTGAPPGIPSGLAVSYCNISGTLQIVYTPGAGATSHTAVMNAVTPSTFSINGVATTTPNHFTFTGYPITQNFAVSIVVTATNIYASQDSVPLGTDTFSPQGGFFQSQGFNMFNIQGPYTSPLYGITVPIDFDPNNNTVFANGFATIPINLIIPGGIWFGNTQVINWNLNTTAGNGINSAQNIAALATFNNTILPWTANNGTLSLLTGMTPGGTLNFQFGWASGLWGAPAAVFFTFKYNQLIGTLVP